MKEAHEKIDFKTGSYFSASVKLIGAVIGVSGVIGGIVIHWVVGILLLVVSGIIFSTRCGIEIDLKKRSYFDYTWFLGFRTGESGDFEELEYIFVKKVKLAQKMHSRVSTSTLHSEGFDGYLKFSESNKVHLLTLRNKEDVVTRVRPLAALLKVPIFDYSEGTARAI